MSRQRSSSNPAKSDRDIGVPRQTSVGYDRQTSVGYDRQTSVGNDRQTSVGYDSQASVGYDRQTSVGYDKQSSAGYARQTSVGYDRQTSVGYDRQISVGSNFPLLEPMGRHVSADSVHSAPPSMMMPFEHRPLSMGDDRKTLVDKGRWLEPLSFAQKQGQYMPLDPTASTSSPPYVPTQDVGTNVGAMHEGYVLSCFLKLRLSLLLITWCYCLVAWIVGAFFLPTLEIQIMPGTAFTSHVTRSLVMTLVDLYNKKTYLAFSLLTLFSVVIPTVKLVCTLWLIVVLFFRPPEDVYRGYRGLIWVLTYMASYQLTDLYVGVLFVSYFNSDSADARFLVGFYWFFRYCIVSMAMSVVLDGTFEHASKDHGNKAADFNGAAPNSGSKRGAHGGGQLGMAVADCSSNEVPGDPGDGFRNQESFVGQRRGGPPHKKDQFELCHDIHKLTDSCTVDEARSFTPHNSPNEWNVCLSSPKLHDTKVALFFSACFALLLTVSFFEPMLEVRTLWSGVAVDRSAHALSTIFMVLMPRLTRTMSTPPCC